MATFFSNQRVGSWGSYPLNCTLTGNVSRSGNTVTLSGLNATFSATNAYGSDSGFAMRIRSGNTVLSSATGLSMSGGSGSKSFGNASVGVSATATSHTFNFNTSDNYTVNFTVSFPSGATPPSGPFVQWQSHTWNSITTKVGISSWGSGYSSGSQELQHIICTSAATASNWDTDSMARRVKAVFTSNTTSTYTVTNANDDWHPSAGAPNIRGCLSYKVASWVQTSVGNAGNSGFDNTTRYTPPAPLQTLSAGSQTYAGNNKANIPLTIIGGNSTNNNNVTVATQYRYSTNGGTSWTAWTQAGTGAPWTTKTAAITVPCNTSVQIQARQVYQSQSSEVKALVVTSIKTPGMTYVSVNGKSKLARKAYFSVNGKSHKVLKIYKGIGGKSKRIF